MANENHERVGRLVTSLMQGMHQPGQICMVCGSRSGPTDGSNGVSAEVLPTISNSPLLLTVEQVGELMGIGKGAVYDLIRKLDLESVKIGRSRRVTYTAVQHCIDKLVEAEKY